MSSQKESGSGGSIYISYVFTKQGIAVFAIVLKSDVAINVSVNIMRIFVELRKIFESIKF